MMMQTYDWTVYCCARQIMNQRQVKFSEMSCPVKHSKIREANVNHRESQTHQIGYSEMVLQRIKSYKGVYGGVNYLSG